MGEGGWDCEGGTNTPFLEGNGGRRFSSSWHWCWNWNTKRSQHQRRTNTHTATVVSLYAGPSSDAGQLHPTDKNLKQGDPESARLGHAMPHYAHTAAARSRTMGKWKQGQAQGQARLYLLEHFHHRNGSHPDLKLSQTFEALVSRSKKGRRAAWVGRSGKEEVGRVK